jgi:hypothetical protein
LHGVTWGRKGALRGGILNAALERLCHPSEGLPCTYLPLLYSDMSMLPPQGTDARSVFNTDNGLAVASIACYSKGFVVGQDNGVVTIFERDEKEFYRKARSFTIENNQCRVK